MHRSASVALLRLLPSAAATVAVLWIVAASSAFAAESVRPNVLLIMTDDQGWGDIHSHGNAKIDTPRLDKLAESGARFDRFYVSPVCAPTRSSLLTGRYNPRTGTHGVTRGMENMRGEEVTIAEIFKAAGYATGCFGKWHNGAHYPYHPNGQGFDEFVGFCAGHWNNYFDTHLQHNGKRIETEGYITDVLTDAALDFIDTNKDQPFFCYVPYNAPHSPWQVPDKYFDKYTQKGLDTTTACAYAMVENIDDNVGRLLDRLDEHDLTDNTIVLFLTDNGPNSNRYNGGMKGRKGSVDEGGVRVPLFVKYPKKIDEGTEVERIAMHIDLLPTLVELCGVPMLETKPLDGTSLVPLVTETAEDWPDRMLFTFRGNGLGRGAVRTDKWRAVTSGKGWQLYDMQNDPGQKQNVAKEHSDVAARLSTAFKQMAAEVSKGSQRPLPVPVGHDEWPVVTMPAHEAFLYPGWGQGIRYEGRSGWANDFITGWTSPDSYAWWDIDVVEGGDYEVTLHYTCGEKNLGCRLQVEADGAKVAGAVEKAHDPKPIQGPDRIGRKEAPEKEWARQKLGTIKLSPGRQRLELKALNIPGEQTADLKAVELRAKN